MGLDMKLTQSVKTDNGNRHDVNAVYWRKANAIHNWFVDLVQSGTDDCKEYPVSADQLTRLHILCTKAIEMYKAGHTDWLKENLPTTSGFFFGSTNYDDWYEEDLVHTKESIEKLLKDDGHYGGCQYYYQSRW